MSPRQRFLACLDRQPITGRVPTFELAFYLTMEAFGTVHPCHRLYDQWMQMRLEEQRLHRRDVASVLIKTAERYEHSAICLHPRPEMEQEILAAITATRELCGDKYAIFYHGDATFAIPDGSTMEGFSVRMVEEPESLKREAQAKVDAALRRAEAIHRHGGLDGFVMCSDYCFNRAPFFSRNMFAEFVAPYLEQLIRAYRGMGFYTIKHTDGAVMPILDMIVECAPHAIHSLDPQGGVDLAEVKRLYGNRVALCGNVNCSLLDTGTRDQIEADARRALRQGMPGGGFIFCTSNTAYTGMPLKNYEAMIELWRNEGNYPL
ncbi:MAG: uroporphyrinogen decarboxylase family protein [Verrucomicrobiae bacterium]